MFEFVSDWVAFLTGGQAVASLDANVDIHDSAAVVEAADADRVSEEEPVAETLPEVVEDEAVALETLDAAVSDDSLYCADLCEVEASYEHAEGDFI